MPNAAAVRNPPNPTAMTAATVALIKGRLCRVLEHTRSKSRAAGDSTPASRRCYRPRSAGCSASTGRTGTRRHVDCCMYYRLVLRLSQEVRSPRVEGRLRRVTEHTCVGELHGCLVHIAERVGQWYLWLMPGGQWTEACLRVGSLADGAKRAREFIGTHGEKRLRTPKRT